MRTFLSLLFFLFVSLPLRATTIHNPLVFPGNHMSLWAPVFSTSIRPYLSGTAESFDSGSPVPVTSLTVSDLFSPIQRADYVADEDSSRDSVAEFARAIPEPAPWFLVATGMWGLCFWLPYRNPAEEEYCLH